MNGLRRLLVRAYPRPWRDRYAAELLDLLEGSERPLRDAVDVLAAAARLRFDDLDRSREMRAIVLPALVLVALGAGWVAWAIPRLAHGAAELPAHWWSAPGPLFLTVGAVLLSVAAGRRLRSGSHDV